MLSDKFWSKVKITSLYGCWEWTAYRDRHGYGQLTLNNKQWYPHRLVYLELIGPIDQGVYHHCDNPPCVNPFHLFTGKQKDNVANAVMKNRNTRGSKCNRGVLTEDDVVKIKELLKKGWTNTSIAKKFKVSRPTVSLIKAGKTWRHVK